MKKILVCMFVVAFGAVAQDKTERRVFMVSGTGWESCRDWQKSTDGFKLGCVMGRWEANAQVAQLLSDIPAARAVKDAFEPSGSLVWGDYIKAVDKLYGDPYNAAITLPNAQWASQAQLFMVGHRLTTMLLVTSVA
jgi:hypothetical protein